MRLCVALALVSTLVSTTVLAAPKDKKKDEGEEKKSGASMDTGGDPAYTEKSDEGPYAPKSGDERADKAAAVKGGSARTEVRLRPRDKVVLFGEVFYAAGRAPVPGPASAGETPDAKALTVMLGATVDLSPKFSLGLRAPWTTASVEEPSRVESESSAAFGSPELFAEYRLRLGRPTELPILFGVAAPIAQGNHDPADATDDLGQRQATVNRIADAGQGWRDGELYAVDRLPIVLGVGIRHQRGAFEVHASTKLVFGINLGEDLTPVSVPGGGELVVNSLSLRDVTLAGVSYQFLDKPGLWAGLDTWLVYEPIEPLEFESSAVDPSPFQFVVEPRVGALFGKLRPSLGVVLPIGGRLADGGLTGFRLHVEYAL